MALHATTMTLLHHPCQRVPIRFGSTTLLGGKITAPRLESACIKSIGLGTHLKHDGINATTLQLVQLHGQRALHPLASDTCPLVVHTLYPSTTKLALGILTINDFYLVLFLLGFGSLGSADGCHEQSRQNHYVLHQGTKIMFFG